MFTVISAAGPILRSDGSAMTFLSVYAAESFIRGYYSVHTHTVVPAVPEARP